MEWALHKFFRKNRVVRPELIDGKSEWFLVSARELAVGIWKVWKAMNILFGDTQIDRKDSNNSVTQKIS